MAKNNERLMAKAQDIKTSLVMEMLAFILGQGQSSRLYQSLIEKAEKQIFNIVATDYYHFKDGGNFMVEANFKPEEKDEAIRLIKEQIEDLIKNGITKQELKKAKKKLKVSFAVNAETVSEIAETIGFYMTVCENLECVNEYVKLLDELTLEDVKAVAQEYLDLNKAVISVLMPENYNKD